MSELKLKPYPYWVCWGCGKKAAGAAGRKLRDPLISTCHRGNCGVCGELTTVCAARNFGYPPFEACEP